MNDISICYGADPGEMTYSLMDQAGVADKLRTRMRVVIKPNLVVSRPAREGGTTHPEIVEGIIRYLRDHGVGDITIAEGSWVGDSTERGWKNCGYTALSQRYGVTLLDTKKDQTVTRSAKGLDLEICRTPLEADFLINVPVLKGHCQTDMTCCLKNMKGCIPDREKRRYHTLGLSRPIAALSTLLRPDLHIIDGICGDLTFEEGGNPVEANRILLGWDGLLLDSYCAGLMGLDPEEIGYLALARDYGLGRFAGEDTTVGESGEKSSTPSPSAQSGITRRLGRYIREDGACSACYAALISALYCSGARPEEPVHIGQGYRGRHAKGLGVGNCAAGCDRAVKGCPPSAVDIIRALEISPD